MSYTPSITATERYATVDVVGQRFAYPVSTSTIADVAAPIKGNNLLKASNNISDSSWTKSNASAGATIDVTLDDGTEVTLTKLMENGTAGVSHYVQQAVTPGDESKPDVFRFLVTGDGTRDACAVYLFGAGADSYRYIFSTADGSLTSSSATGTGALGSYTSLQLGTHDGRPVWLITLQGTRSTTPSASVTATRIHIYSGSITFNGDGVSGLFIGQMQLTEGTEATTYNQTGIQPTNLVRNSILQAMAGGAPGTAPTDWTIAFGTSTVSTVVATTINDGTLSQAVKFDCDATERLMYTQTIDVISGVQYTFSAQLEAVSGSVGDFLTVVAGTATATINQTVTNPLTTGLKTLIFTATSTGNLALRIGVGTTAGVGATVSATFSRPQVAAGSVAPAYVATQPDRISGDGQRLTHSGDLSNAAWTKTNVTGVSAGSIAYTNAATLDTGEVLSMAGVYETVTNATHVVVQSSDVNANVSAVGMVKVKGGLSRDYVQIRMLNASATSDYAYANFRFSTGAFSTGATLAGTAVSATVGVESLGDGAYELRMTAVCSTAAGVARLQVMILNDSAVDSYAGDVTKGAYITEPILVAGTTAPSYTRSYADRLAAGGSTRDRAYVLIPHIDEFDAAGDHIGTRWNTEQTWAVTDGTTTATSTESFAPPVSGDFESVGPGPYEWPPDGVTPGDDGYMHLLTGAGTFTTDVFSFAPTEASTFKSMAFNVTDGEWLGAYEGAESPVSPPASNEDSHLAVIPVIRNIIRYIV